MDVLVDTAGTPTGAGTRAEPANRPITIRDVLTHTSGLAAGARIELHRTFMAHAPLSRLLPDFEQVVMQALVDDRPGRVSSR